MCSSDLYKLDSLICFNNSNTKLIGSLQQFSGSMNKKLFSSGIHYFFGEKINNEWYYWTGAYIVIPREMFEGHDPKKSLSYDQLHKTAMREVFSGYLTKDGQINKKWFDYHFKPPPMWDYKKNNYKKCINNKECDTLKIAFALAKWVKKSECVKYDNNDFNLRYNKSKSEINFRLRLKTPDSLYLKVVGYRLHFKHESMSILENIPGGSNVFYIDRHRTKFIKQKISNIPSNGQIEFYIDQLYFGRTWGKRLGPYVFKVEDLPVE